MKILLAYDGSECADAAVDDLRRSGLPPEAEVVVLTVADAWLPPPSPSRKKVAESDFEERISVARERARTRAMKAVEDAHILAVRAQEKVQNLFPTWNVRAEAYADSPAWGVIKKIDDWQPDLTIVGSHGHSALSRFLLGSISHKVLTEARCTVRVARGRVVDSATPIHIVVGVDGSPDAEAAVHAVAQRVWPPGSGARVIAVLDQALAMVVEGNEEGDADTQVGVQKIVNNAAEKLRAIGLAVTPIIQEGDPKKVLVEEAEQWGADCIFVGARGLRGLERLLLGSVSSAVAMRAHCSVEVVHPKR